MTSFPETPTSFSGNGDDGGGAGRGEHTAGVLRWTASRPPPLLLVFPHDDDFSAPLFGSGELAKAVCSQG